MASIHLDTIYPCPFSKSYGIPKKEAWLLLKIFFLYRFILSGSLMIMYHSLFSQTVIESNYLTFYNYTSKIYFLLAILSGISLFWKKIPYTIQAQSVIFIDIIVLTLIMHSCGGVSSGFGLLLATSLAAAGLLIGGRCSMVFAALATISILAEQVYGIRLKETSISSYPTAGMLGATFFITAFLPYVLAKRSEKSDMLNNQQQQTIVTLEELNQYIIQHLQSGIVIFNKHQHIQMANEAALTLLKKSKMPRKLTDISDQLKVIFQDWLNNKNQEFFILPRPNQANLHLRFNLLNTQHEKVYMLMIEDMSLYNQKLQQGVLASLGRLTAGIAHEIRNPLSAITHATQLLSENSQFNTQDKRLTEIILNHSGRVNKIISDILLLSKKNVSNEEKIELNSWLREYLEDFRIEQLNHRGYIELILPNNVLFTSVDTGHLKQIMDNLCLNALSYGCPEKGAIVLKLSEITLSPCIDVIDHGKEIDSETVALLFQPFFTTSTEGTGLGLYLSRELAELNRSTLCYVENKEQKNCFRLQLPANHKVKIEL